MSGYIEPTPYVGTYLSAVALAAAQPTGYAGAMAIVDAGAGSDATLFTWDTDAAAWVQIGAGGGGGSIPSISVDTTYTVGAGGGVDYSTLQDAIDAVAGIVRLSGAIATIEYQDASIAEQATIDGLNFSDVVITNAGAVTVDPSAFAPNLFGIKAMINVTNGGVLRDLNGTWNSSGGESVLCTFLAKATCGATLDGWGKAVASLGGELTALFATITNSTVGVWGSGVINVSACSIGAATGIQAFEGALVAASDNTFSDASVAYIANTRSTVTSISNTFNNTASSGVIYKADRGQTNAASDTLNLSGGDPVLIESFGGRVALDNLAGAGVSTGARFTVGDGGIIQADASTIVPTFGADSQAALIPTASGLILA